MAIDEINAMRARQEAGACVVDPASNWPLFAAENQAQDRHLRLLDQREPQVGAAGGRGNERPAVLPGAVRGEELSKNVFYTVQRLTSRLSAGLFDEQAGWRAVLLAPIMCTRAPPTRSCAPTCKGVADKDIDENTRRSATGLPDHRG
jgi:hypothetical protein